MYYTYVLMITISPVPFWMWPPEDLNLQKWFTLCFSWMALFLSGYQIVLLDSPLQSWPCLPSVSPGGGNIRYPTPQKGPSRHKLTHFSPIVIVT